MAGVEGVRFPIDFTGRVYLVRGTGDVNVSQGARPRRVVVVDRCACFYCLLLSSSSFDTTLIWIFVIFFSDRFRGLLAGWMLAVRCWLGLDTWFGGAGAGSMLGECMIDKTGLDWIGKNRDVF